MQGQGPADRSPKEESALQLMENQADPTPKDVNGGNGQGGSLVLVEHGEEDNRPEAVFLRRIGKVAAEAARRATLYTVADWTQRAERHSESVVREMGTMLGQHLEATASQTAATWQQHRADLLDLHASVQGRLRLHEDVISSIGGGLEHVRQHAQLQGIELERLEATAHSAEHGAAQRMADEMGRKIEALERHLTDNEATFAATSQRLADEAQLASAMDSERRARAMEETCKRCTVQCAH